MSPAGRDAETVVDKAAAEGGLERAAAILGAFDEDHRRLTLARLVRRCGLPRSTTHRLADRMLRLGWLDKPDERYQIGNRLFELSGLAPVRRELREAVLPFLQDLYAATHVTVQLGIFDATEVLIVEKITGHRPMPMLSQVGGTIPAYCSGLGRAILSHSDEATLQAVVAAGMPARTSRTVTTEVRLRRELTLISARGWAIDQEEGNVGVTCVAAPVFGPLHEVVAAISVTGPSALVDTNLLGPMVRLAAASASRAYSTRR